VFGSFTQYLLFDCNGLPSCEAMRAFDTEEGSGCWHCQFHGWGNGGKGLHVCAASAMCQNSSFQDLYVSITPGVNTWRVAHPLFRFGVPRSFAFCAKGRALSASQNSLPLNLKPRQFPNLGSGFTPVYFPLALILRLVII
jgi:hypothetical protein